MANEESGEANTMASIMGLGKLPKYNGRTSIRVFIKTIKKRAKLESWNDDQTAQIMRYLCTDLAEAYLDSHTELDDVSLEDLCRNLNDRFKQKVTKTEAYSQLLAIRQSDDNISEFAGRIESCAGELTEILTELGEPESRDELLISVFMTGVSAVIKRMIVSNSYKEFSELVRAAKRCERTLPDQKRSAVNAVEETGENVIDVNNFEYQIEGNNGYGRGNGYNSNRGNYQRGRGGRPNWYNNVNQGFYNRGNGARQNYYPPGCWNCGSMEHFRSHCDQPQRHLGNQNSKN